MISVIRKLEFDAAHRVMNHESKCATLHGHRYVVEVEVASEDVLDSLGRVVDFSVIKAVVGSWMDEHWDHTAIIFKEDTQTIEALKLVPHRKPVFVTDWNPTAENMARWLHKEKIPELLQGTSLTVKRVTVWETPNCKAVSE